MKKYTKPAVEKIVVDSQIIRMFTRKGFIEVFWEELQEQRSVNPKVSQKTVFESLNERFYSVFGEFRYSCYDTFRQGLNK